MEIFVLPDVGEGLTEADIITWHVAEGDTVTVNQVLVEIETAKSLVELPSPFAGTVAKLHFAEGDTVQVGENLITINTGSGSPQSGSDGTSASAPAETHDGDSAEAPLVGSGPIAEGVSRRRRRNHAAASAPASSPALEPEPAPEPEPVLVGAGAPVEQPVAKAGIFERVLAKPPVRKLAKERGLDLAAITPTGLYGEVTRKDVEAFQAGTSAPSAAQTRTTVSADRVEKVPVKGVRKATAAAVKKSYTEAPHITLFAEVDATRTMELVNRLKSSKDFSDVRVSPLLIMARALMRAIKRTPFANSEWTEENILVKNYVNLGIAAATPRGLLVPNIKDAHDMSLHELAASLNELADRAREGKTQPEEMADTTVSITNIGSLGLDAGTPILNPGSAAIIAFGAIKQKPWVVDGEIQPRWVVQLAGSFDHRILDGDGAGQVMKDIAVVLEEPALLADI